MRFGSPTRLVAAFVATAALIAPSSAREPDERLGVWRSPDGSRTLLLEASRAGWSVDGEATFYRVAPGEGDALVFESWGRVTTYECRLTEGGLAVRGGDVSGTFERLGEVPAELLVEPYELPEVIPMDAELVKMLDAELLARRDEDQRVRNGSRDEMDPAEMQRVDEDNTEFVRNVVLELGWIDADRFGAEASHAAFLIVQHTSDKRLMRTALPFIEADAKAGKVSGQNYALMHDRLQLNLGYRQRYGSQIGVVDGVSVLMPCEDLAGIDARRAEMGMGSLKNYLEYFREEGDPPIRHLGTDVDAAAATEEP